MGAWWQQEAANEDPPELAQGLQGVRPLPLPRYLGGNAPEDLLGGIDVMFGITTSAADPEAAFTVLADFIKRRRWPSTHQYVQRPTRCLGTQSRVVRQ